MLHGLTVCPNALTVDIYVLTVVYICFIKKALTVDVYVLTVVYICFIKKAKAVKLQFV